MGFASEKSTYMIITICDQIRRLTCLYVFSTLIIGCFVMLNNS